MEGEKEESESMGDVEGIYASPSVVRGFQLIHFHEK